MDAFDRRLHQELSTLYCYMAAMGASSLELQALDHAMTAIRGRAIPDSERRGTRNVLRRIINGGEWVLDGLEEFAIRHAIWLIQWNGRFSAYTDQDGSRVISIIPLEPAEVLDAEEVRDVALVA
jgi:hypothetical protein